MPNHKFQMSDGENSGKNFMAQPSEGGKPIHLNKNTGEPWARPGGLNIPHSWAEN